MSLCALALPCVRGALLRSTLRLVREDVEVVEDLEVAEAKCRSIRSALGIEVYGHIYDNYFYRHDKERKLHV